MNVPLVVSTAGTTRRTSMTVARASTAVSGDVLLVIVVVTPLGAVAVGVALVTNEDAAAATGAGTVPALASSMLTVRTTSAPSPRGASGICVARND
jgi:hypothetical protein